MKVFESSLHPTCWPNDRDGAVLLASRLEDTFFASQVESLNSQIVRAVRGRDRVYLQVNVHDELGTIRNAGWSIEAGQKFLLDWRSALADPSLEAVLEMKEIETWLLGGTLAITLADREQVFMVRRTPYSRVPGNAPTRCGITEVEDCNSARPKTLYTPNE